MYTYMVIMIIKGVIFIEDDKVKSEKKFHINPKLLFFLIVTCVLIATFFISFYGYLSYIEYEKEEAKAKDNGIRISDTTASINNHVSSVKRETISLITNIHNALNNSICYDNTPDENFYNSCKSYAEELKKASDKEDWDCLKFDLERASLNLEDASNTENLQCLVITHRILHDLDANVFNKNNDSSNRATYDISITYLSVCGKVYEPPEEMPPAGA